MGLLLVLRLWTLWVDAVESEIVGIEDDRWTMFKW